VRTTLTIDDDIARLLDKEMRRSGESFKQTVNRALRSGLAANNLPQRRPYTVHARPLGLPAGLSYDNVAELLEAMEGPLHK
jgi:hypothetical protein